MTLAALGSAVTLHSAVALTNAAQNATVQIGEVPTIDGGSSANSVILNIDWPTGGDEDNLIVVLSFATVLSPQAADWYVFKTITITDNASAHANAALMYLIDAGTDIPYFAKMLRVGILCTTPGASPGAVTTTAELCGLRKEVVIS